MIYEKASNPSVQKYVLSIMPHKSGGVWIEAQRNLAEKEQKTNDTQGVFAAKVAIGQSRKQNKVARNQQKQDYAQPFLLLRHPHHAQFFHPIKRALELLCDLCAAQRVEKFLLVPMSVVYHAGAFQGHPETPHW